MSILCNLNYHNWKLLGFLEKPISDFNIKLKYKCDRCNSKKIKVLGHMFDANEKEKELIDNHINKIFNKIEERISQLENSNS